MEGGEVLSRQRFAGEGKKKRDTSRDREVEKPHGWNVQKKWVRFVFVLHKKWAKLV